MSIECVHTSEPVNKLTKNGPNMPIIQSELRKYSLYEWQNKTIIKPRLDNIHREI